jgi:hypothetical protein
MSKKEKLKKRFLSKPKDFTYDELRSLLISLGFEESNKGKTSGSRVSFIHSVTKLPIDLHKPHPKNILKAYQVNQILEELTKQGLL